MSSRFQHRAGMLPGVVVSAVAYASDGIDPGVHRGLPSPWITFIVSVDGPVRVSGTVAEGSGFDEGSATAYDVMVAGLHPVAALVEQPARQQGVQLALHPLAVGGVLGCAASDLVGLGDHGRDVLGPVAAELHERVAAHDDDQSRLDVVQDWVRRRVDTRASRRSRPEVARAWEVLRRTRGRARIEDVARDVALSPRQLRVLVRRELGLGPKQLARGFRFEAVKGALVRGDTDLARVAAATGYADQSHLARDFHELVGCSPTAWLAEERRNIQDGGHRLGEE